MNKSVVQGLLEVFGDARLPEFAALFSADWLIDRTRSDHAKRELTRKLRPRSEQGTERGR